jgi:hypothetical protein
MTKSTYSKPQSKTIIKPLKNYSLKSICTYIHQNLEVIIFIFLALVLVLYINYKTTDGFMNDDIPIGINQMDAIIYINLENRQDRKKLFLGELELLKTDMSKVHKISGVFIPKNGHKGCVQAHILALNLAKLNNWDMVLIMEDDAELNMPPDDVNKIINKTLSTLDKNNIKWDVIMLAGAYKQYKEDEPIDITIMSTATDNSTPATDTKSNITPNTTQQQIEKGFEIKKLKSATTSSAYIVKSHYYNAILDVFNNCNTNMPANKLTGENYEHNALDQQWAKLQNADNWYCLNNDLIKQRAIWSTIMNESHKN